MDHQAYDMHVIQSAILHLTNRKETGTDGIPGGVYKIIQKHPIAFILDIANNVMRGQSIPEHWTGGK